MCDSAADVFDSGAVRLGSNVVCDGFVDGYNFRIQTHVHDDHMAGFNTSKGRQDIYMSPETFALLNAFLDAEIPYRSNFHKIQRGVEYELPDYSKLVLLPSNHMLGSCQVALQLPNNCKVGYSGDFGWPLDEVIQVDQLVVDSTYGSPNSIRGYTQAAAEECLLELVYERLRHGPVHIYAHRGTVERVLHIIEGNVRVPILASGRLIHEVAIYQDHGIVLGMLDHLDSDEGKSASRQRSYIRLYSKGDGFGNEPIADTSIKCSAYMATHSTSSPLMSFSEKSFSVALSNHADFLETLEYIIASGARTVVTDNTRNHGVELANAINERLSGVKARPSTNDSPPR
ncbi:MAG: hypothetical protein F4120_06655 [Rhodothermaceae bacterium]|nr:hypothetical protein [Gammaproteobacteria bacterium]MXW15583.1 hypothetical protein [Rhodothermaceae bacterium]MYC05463.1 hypothetical protein [Rhodothermaceae bacterium]MYI17288.1 hypothetical protein [Rhodothermaceae bacterium]